MDPNRQPQHQPQNQNPPTAGAPPTGQSPTNTSLSQQSPPTSQPQQVTQVLKAQQPQQQPQPTQSPYTNPPQQPLQKAKKSKKIAIIVLALVVVGVATWFVVGALRDSYTSDTVGCSTGDTEKISTGQIEKLCLSDDLAENSQNVARLFAAEEYDALYSASVGANAEELGLSPENTQSFSEFVEALPDMDIRSDFIKAYTSTRDNDLYGEVVQSANDLSDTIKLTDPALSTARTVEYQYKYDGSVGVLPVYVSYLYLEQDGNHYLLGLFLSASEIELK